MQLNQDKVAKVVSMYRHESDLFCSVIREDAFWVHKKPTKQLRTFLQTLARIKRPMQKSFKEIKVKEVIPENKTSDYGTSKV